MCSNSESSDSVEWEEVEGEDSILAPIPAFSHSNDNIQIVVAQDHPAKRKKDNFYERALKTYQHQLRVNIHKVHLLCLLSHGQYVSGQCDQPLSQALLLSLTPKMFALADPTDLCNEKMFLRLLNWLDKCFYNDNSYTRQSKHLMFVSDVATLREKVAVILSDVQILVTILRSLGFRTRYVLVLQPSAIKPSNRKLDNIKNVNHSPPDQTTESKGSKFSALDKFKYKSPSKHKGRVVQKRRKVEKSDMNTTSPYFNVSSSSESDDFTPVAKRKRTQSKSPSNLIKQKKEKVGTSSTNDFHNKISSMHSIPLYDSQTSWVEVLLTSGKWRPLHIPSVSVGQPSLCEKHCPVKLSYVLAFEQNFIRDVTARYSSQWCTNTCKTRIDDNWWAESLQCYAPPIDEYELEDDDIRGQLLSHPLPTLLSHYKNHPLYVLKRHLLKFQAIYPEDSQILGYFKGEPVYSRDCVHTLHTRETWLKEGLVVKRGEQPFKVVQSRKKKGQTSLEAQANTVEVFGRWQTEIYIPPPVVNGRVTKNEYGNVELFTSSMLPEGAVHLNEPGIGKVARKLDIDYAPAMKGWEFHGGGYCHPVIDGIVIAKEYKEVLLEAWEQEQQIIIEKDVQKRHKRTLERWVKLTNSLLIRERVRKRYGESIEDN